LCHSPRMLIAHTPMGNSACILPSPLRIHLAFYLLPQRAIDHVRRVLAFSYSRDRRYV
jgi:hypothetical protein